MQVFALSSSSSVSDPAPDSPLINLSRRGFVLGTSAAVFGLSLLSGRARADLTAGGLEATPGGDATPSLFITLESDGRVRLVCHRSEMGQQTWTAMAQLLADGLEADWSKVEVVQAEGHPRYGDQNTDGSRSVRYNFHRLRVAGGAMRLMLERAAAERWGVPAGTCRAELGVVHHGKTGRKLSFGELAEAVARQPAPRLEDVKLPPGAGRYIGQPMPSLTVPLLVEGAGTFGIDVKRPGMLHAVVLRPPQVFGGPREVDDAATLRTPGVVRTVRLPRPEPPAGFQPLGGVAVVAKDTWAAIQGRRALKVTWDPGPNAGYDSKAFESELRAIARRPGVVRRARGDVDAALAAAKTKVAAEYYVPHLAHAPMEPPVACAEWDGDRVTLWGSIQAPQSARKAVAKACGVPEDAVTVRVTWLGGGFGRKSKPDFFVEAALVARAAKAPVKLTWTREDDLQHGYLHTVSAQRLEAGLDDKGACAAWLHRTVFPSISTTFNPGAKGPSDGEMRLGASDTPFAVPNLRLESGHAPAHVRIGWLRSVSNIYHAFAVQSFAAELAHAANRDPKDYLLELIGPPRTVDPTAEGAVYDNYGSPPQQYPIDTARLAHVTEKAAEMAGWGRALAAGHGLGIAAHRSFVSYVATVIEVWVDEAGRLTIVGVWSAMDAGTVVNPNHAAAQLEGGTLFGLSNALYGEITAEGGAIVQSNFPSYRIMRMNESPRTMEVHLVPSNAPPGGVGEPPTPPAAPALANAIFAASGHRVRRLPVFGADLRDRLPSKVTS